MRRIKWEHILIFILVFTLCSELIWHATSLFDYKSSFSLTYSKTGQKFTVDYSMHTSIMLDAKILLIPVTEEPTSDMPICFFYDPSYPAIGTDWERFHMLWSNLNREMFLRNFKGEIGLVSAKELENLMSNKEKVIVIIGSGALPANVFSRDKNLVTPWLDSGGILLWFGWPPGYYTVYEGQVDNESFSSLPQHLLQEGVNRLGLGDFVKTNPFAFPLETADNSSLLSNLLEINYNLIQYGLLTDRLPQDDLILGKTGGNPSKSSVSVVPVGMGKIVVFGFFVLGSYILNGPELSARDIAQILDSGIIYTSENLPPVYKEHRLLAGESVTDKIELEVNSDSKGVIVYVYSTTVSNSFLFHSEFIPNT
jgi:hypothetical protein